MPRIRTIKPDFFKSETIEGLSSDTTRLLFVGLWTYVDDYGRGRDDARLVRAEIFPLRDDMSAVEVERMLSELASVGVISRYEAHGKRYLHVTNWSEHQRVSRPTDSRYPAPHEGQEIPPDQDSRAATASSMENIESSAQEKEREVEKEQGKGKGSVEPPPEALRLSNLLADLIEVNGSKRPAVTKAWWEAIDRMLRLDARTEQEIEASIRWCQQDQFWHRNILSPAKLREKFDRLRLDARAQRNKQRDPGGQTIDRIDSLLAQMGSTT